MAIIAGCDPLLMIDVFVWYLYLGWDYAFVLELSLLCESIFNAKDNNNCRVLPKELHMLGYMICVHVSHH